MALIISPDGTQIFVTLPTKSAAERKKALTAIFDGDSVSPGPFELRENSMAKRLKFVQVAYGLVGKPPVHNKAAIRFGCLQLYYGKVAFLRREEAV